MTGFVVEALAIRFASGDQVGPVDFVAAPGACTLLTGPSGAGKTTVLRCLAGLSVRGTVSGRVVLAGRAPSALPPHERPTLLGFVAQDPLDQLVCGTVADELAFSAACAGWSAAAVDAAVRRSAAAVGLSDLLARDPRTLSSGQQQRLVIGAAVAAGARFVVLDEPLAHLDSEGAAAVVSLLSSLAADGVGVVLADHRSAALAPLNAKRVSLGQVSVPAAAPKAARTPGNTVLVVKSAAVSYGKTAVLKDLSLEVRQRERIALLGPNGVGKSTLLGLLAGRVRPNAGTVAGPGRAIEVPADPDLTLFCATVADELAYGPLERGEPFGHLDAIVDAFGLRPYLSRPPQALSKGQRQRVAVAAGLCARPDLLLLDEPTAGQDPAHVEALMAEVDRQAGEGAVVFATHDTALAARHASRLLSVPQLPVPPVPAPSKADRTLDVRAKIGLVVAASGFAVLFDQVYGLAIVACLAAVALWRASAGRPWFATVMGVALATVVSTVWTQGLFYAGAPRTPWFELGPVVLWREGMVHGAVQAVRLVGMAFAGTALAVSTPPDRLLAGLVRLRVPHGPAFLAATALRFVPVVAREWAVVRQARAHRGRPTWARPPWRMLALEMGLLAPVVARSIRRARILAESLQVRGFDPVKPRRLRVDLRMGPVELAALTLTYGALLVLLVAKGVFAAHLLGLYSHPALRPVVAWVRAWC